MGPITYTFEELLAHKESGAIPSAAIEKLREKADAILQQPTMVITAVKLPRPSGDNHDYISVAPYWWPNPDTPDGLPYVRRDGYGNPDTRTGITPGAVFERVLTLALACVYLGDNGYSEYANRQLYDWYMNPETKMNPNSKYGQGIPGLTEGRGAGLITFGSSYKLYNAIGILECMGLIKPEILSGVKEWVVEFTNWVLTHELGKRIDNSADNHAQWYSANILASAVFTERQALTRKLAATTYRRRTRVAVLPDGSQPIELRRTKAIAYSLYNLEAMIAYSNIAERLGYKEHWGIDEERGECILKKAVDFVYPFVKDPESCPYPDLHHGSYSKRMAKVMMSVAKRFPNEGYAERSRELWEPDDVWALEPIM